MERQDCGASTGSDGETRGAGKGELEGDLPPPFVSFFHSCADKDSWNGQKRASPSRWEALFASG